MKRIKSYRLEQLIRRVLCRASLVWQSEDMFGRTPLVRDSLLRPGSKECEAVVFLIVCKNKIKKLKKLLSFHPFAAQYKSYLKARNLEPGNNGLVGGAQTSKGALTVQKARMLHRYQLQ